MKQHKPVLPVKKTSGPLQVDDQETDGFCLQIAFAPYTHPLRMYSVLHMCQNSSKINCFKDIKADNIIPAVWNDIDSIQGLKVIYVFQKGEVANQDPKLKSTIYSYYY